MKKRTIAVLLTMAMAAAMMAGCGSKSDSKTADGEKSYTIGISQFAEHGSLDNCREGFLEGLKEEGIEEGIELAKKVFKLLSKGESIPNIAKICKISEEKVKEILE